MSFSPLVSIIVPVYNEPDLSSWLSELVYQADYPDLEVIVVDGDPDGSSLQFEAKHPLRTLISPQSGRAAQMNFGATQARGYILLFLHADTQLPKEALALIVKKLRQHPELTGGAFDLGIDSPRLIFRLIETLSSWRSRLSRLPFGDQALFVRKSVFDELGGFAAVPLMEDIAWGQRLKRAQLPIHIFDQRVRTSARRWQSEGWLYTMLRNWGLQILYFGGVSPRLLARYYPRHDSHSGKKSKLMN